MSPGSGLNLRGVVFEKGLTGHSAHLAHILFPGSAIQCDGKGQAGVLAQRSRMMVCLQRRDGRVFRIGQPRRLTKAAKNGKLQGQSKVKR